MDRQSSGKNGSERAAGGLTGEETERKRKMAVRLESEILHEGRPMDRSLKN